MFDDDMTLRDARALLRELADKGHDCPCCRQFVKVYRHKLQSSVARGLILAYRIHGTEWFHFPTLLGHQATTETQAWWWGLLERMPGKRGDGSSKTGWWRITPDGEAFVRRQIAIPKYAVLYNSRVLKLEGEQVGILSALGKRFNYADLMAGV